MTDPKLVVDMENTIKWLQEYFDEEKGNILLDIDQKNEEIKKDTLKKIKEVSEEK